SLRAILADFQEAPSDIESWITASAPALWIHHSGSINEFFGALTTGVRDSAYGAILDFLMERRIPQDAWQRPPRRISRMTFEIASDVISILKEVQTDHI